VLCAVAEVSRSGYRKRPYAKFQLYYLSSGTRAHAQSNDYLASFRDLPRASD